MRHVAELSEDKKSIRFYGVSDYQVSSIAPSDMPSGGGTWVSGYSESGVAYVCSWKKRGLKSEKFMRTQYAFPARLAVGENEIAPVDEEVYA